MCVFILQREFAASFPLNGSFRKQSDIKYIICDRNSLWMQHCNKRNMQYNRIVQSSFHFTGAIAFQSIEMIVKFHRFVLLNTNDASWIQVKKIAFVWYYVQFNCFLKIAVVVNRCWRLLAKAAPCLHKMAHPLQICDSNVGAK